MDNEEKRRLFLEVFSSDAGKKVLKELKRDNHWFTGDLPVNERVDCYIHGRRAVICDILNVMGVDDE